jgi:hypothetical protein
MKNLMRLLPILLLLPAFASAQEAKLEVDPGDRQLVIKGWLGEDNSFVGNIRVTLHGVAQGATPPKLSILPSDLKRTQGNELIGRQLVDLPKEMALTPELPTTIPVKVTGIKEYGEYKGKIELLLAGQSRESAETIDFTVVAEVHPTLTLLTESDRVKANLVNCNNDCWLARLLLPASSLQGGYELRFEKPVAAPLIIVDKAFAVKGEKTQFQLTEKHLSIALPSPSPSASPLQAGQPQTGEQSQSLTDSRFITVPVTLDYGALPPDHYTGTIYLSLKGQTASIKVPVDINVRSGPLWPLLFLLGGIILGKLVKYMQDKGNPKADALVSVNRVEYRLQSAHEDDRAIIAPMVAEARRRINEDDVEQVTPLIKSIEARLATLNELREIEARLVGKEQHPVVQEIKGHIQQARELIRLGQDADVKTHVDAIKTALVGLSTTMMGDDQQPNPDIMEAFTSAKTAAAATDRATMIAPAAGPPTRWRRIRNGLVWLTGVSDEVRTEATLWILRPLLWLVLILGLIALGMKSLYVDNPIFGASSFDYLSLIFWGLSADVASRKLSSLKITNADNTAAG